MRKERHVDRLEVLLQPLVCGLSAPVKTRQIATRSQRQTGQVAVCEQLRVLSLSEMAETFSCADSRAAYAKTWVLEWLGHFADMH